MFPSARNSLRRNSHDYGNSNRNRTAESNTNRNNKKGNNSTSSSISPRKKEGSNSKNSSSNNNNNNKNNKEKNDQLQRAARTPIPIAVCLRNVMIEPIHSEKWHTTKSNNDSDQNEEHDPYDDFNNDYDYHVDHENDGTITQSNSDNNQLHPSNSKESDFGTNDSCVSATQSITMFPDASDAMDTLLSRPSSTASLTTAALANSSSVTAKKKLWFRPDHTRDLLPQLELEIIINDSQVVYSCPPQQELLQQSQSQPAIPSTPFLTIHPSWEHLDERIDLPEDAWWCNNEEMYKTMKMRFWKHATTICKDMEKQSTDGEAATKTKTERTLFMEVPMYPSKLERLIPKSDRQRTNAKRGRKARNAKKQQEGNTSFGSSGSGISHNDSTEFFTDDEDDDDDDFFNNGRSGNSNAPLNQLPAALPPNSALLYYSDGSARVQPQLYDILLQNRLVQPSPLESFSRFGDDIFDMLLGDHPGTSDITSQPITEGNRERSASSLLGPPVEETTPTGTTATVAVAVAASSDDKPISGNESKTRAKVTMGNVHDSTAAAMAVAAFPDDIDATPMKTRRKQQSTISTTTTSSTSDSLQASSATSSSRPNVSNKDINVPTAVSSESTVMSSENNDKIENSKKEGAENVIVNDENNNNDGEVHDDDKVLPSYEFSTTEQGAIHCDLEEQRILLEKLILQEELAMEEEMLSLRQEQEALSELLEETKSAEEDISLVQKELDRQTILLQKDKLIHEAQAMKLIHELRLIFPIRVDPQKGYLIRNLRLPVDIYTTMVPDDEISAALGFCCQLVFMMSKYLSVSLKYKLLCNSSRSAIQYVGGPIGGGTATGAAGSTSTGTAAAARPSTPSPGGGAVFAPAQPPMIFPLFVAARLVDKEQLERGMALLSANVDCILQSYQITDYAPQSHILARLDKIYHHMSINTSIGNNGTTTTSTRT